MNETESLIFYGISYIEALGKLNESLPECVYAIHCVLDRIHTDPDYHLGIYIEEPSEDDAPSHACDQSWFHCYQGNEEPIMRRPYSPLKWRDGDNDNMLYLRFTFGMFDHLTIEQSKMGAWQAYLLCISKTILPFSGGLYYTKRKLIFTKDQLQTANPFWLWKPNEQIKNLQVDLSPSVSINGNQMIVSCCYWSDWKGLVRENLQLSISEDGKAKIGNFHDEILFKYNCGIRF